MTVPTFEEENVERIRPVPSAVLPKEWKIRESQNPQVDIEGGVMNIPLGASNEDLAHRLHEMIHIKVSPANRVDLKVSKRIQELLSPLEDYRINSLITPAQHGGAESFSGYRYGRMKRVSDELGNIPPGIREDFTVQNLKMLEKYITAPQIPPEHKLLGVLASGGTAMELIREGKHYADIQAYVEEQKKAGRPVDPNITLPITHDDHDENFKLCNKLGVDGHAMYKMVMNIAKSMFPFTGLEKQVFDLMNEIHQSFNYDLRFNNVVKQARKWAKEFKALEQQQQEQEQIHQQAMNDRKNMPGTEEEKQFQQMVQEGTEALCDKADRYAKKKGARQVPNFPEAQELELKEALEGVVMDIRSCKLEVYKPFIHSRRKAPEYVGAVPKHMERLPFDGQVFERKMRGKGGTVLIDNSGSMSLSETELEKLIRFAPAVMTGVYHGDKDTNHGILWIVSAHGRMAGPEEIHKIEEVDYHYNIVDVPALDWLTKQRPPRIWVSDGGVTGKNHNQYPIIPKQCMYLCLRYGIIRVRRVEDALRLFEGKLMFTTRAGRMTYTTERGYKV